MRSIFRLAWGLALLLNVLISAESLCSDLALSDGKAAEVERGKNLFETRACRSCHMLAGEGALIGPTLDQVMLRRTESWLRQWLRDPSAMKPGTMMVEFDWSDDQLQSLFAYLEQFKQPVNPAEILAREKNTTNAGEALIKAYQCRACHNVTGVAGRPIYPNLASVEERRTAEWVRNWLRDPQAVKAGTFMPTFPFTEEEINAIVTFLYQ